MGLVCYENLVSIFVATKSSFKRHTH